ncbi:2-amino-4-hydroxy-6-hydroxymethyldihydropteridine diphosphokinase [Falsigemmobacter intermedius]|uniref:2-amino-4-hydroxy-6-hydroxymethyldihydropteridine pyrophosphokinase n=1 Tax=Falsigemmobacter intermedius TaxID=1553448 RepID=A0A3S3VUH4_9RHOB|nr:2-amino-4-hydroxy-6-hydroxymethyldihydropteridine diphosphokinase [Falsigemmobacter intermedius]RWY42441.1 2-amino-4-hydroxy-6-hydroxymethyldihydropteridine diphosphokinase [Falsigemmobacter intermedius]
MSPETSPRAHRREWWRPSDAAFADCRTLNRVKHRLPQQTSTESVTLLSPSEKRVIIAAGANLPVKPGKNGPGASAPEGPCGTISRVAGQLESSGFKGLIASPVYRTPAFPAGSGPDYANAAFSALWSGSATEALAALHAIEAEAGRERLTRWGARTLDLDLIAVDNAVLPDRAGFDTWLNLPAADQIRRSPDQLILPHPRLQDRAFVLVPVADVAPDWRHPVLGRTIRELCDALPATERAEVRLWDHSET